MATSKSSPVADVGEYSVADAIRLGVKIFKYADKKDQVLMAVGFTAAFLSGAGMPAYSQVQGNVVGKMAANESDIGSKLSTLALILVIVGVVMMILHGIRGYCVNYTTMRQTTRIKLLYFKALMRQEVAWHDAHPPGELTSRMDGDVKIIERAMGDNLIQGIQNVGTLLFAFGVAFYNGWELTLFMLGAMPFICGVSILFGRMVIKSTKDARTGYACAGGIALEAIDNIKTVQVFGREQFESNRFSEAVLPAMAAGMKREIATFMTTGCNNCIIYIVYGLAFWFGAYLILWDRYDVSQVLVVFFACLMASFAVGRFSPCLSTFVEGASAAEQIYAVIDRVPSMDPMVKLGTEGALDESPAENAPSCSNAGLALPGRRFSNEIVFRDVAFHYPTRPEDKLFTTLNVTIKKGQTVAFSGASGCGKSSIIGLLQRYYDPQSGLISVDGLELNQLNLRAWRDCISIVSQEPKLFTGTVMENVRIAKPDASDEEVIEACKKAHVHQVIEKLPEQYATLVGTGGSQLSGGQKQRVAIARALIRKPQILILDEATSALDRKSEVEVLRSRMLCSRAALVDPARTPSRLLSLPTGLLQFKMPTLFIT